MNKKDALKKIKYSLRFLPDKMYIQIYYFLQFRKKCDLVNPKTYNEKLQWLKINDKNPKYTKMVDKYAVKDYVSKIIGEEYIIPTLGIWDNFDEIDFNKLPEQFVLKCTHDSEGVVIVENKSTFNKKNARNKLNSALKKNFFYIGREWPYKNVKPRIIAEKYIKDKKCNDLKDYKFFCFDGEPKLMFIASDRGKGETKFDFYDLNFNHLNIKQHYPNSNNNFRPKQFEKMIELSRKLSKGIPHVRVDFYEVEGKVFFGEMTFYHFSGFQPFNPPKWDIELGKFINLQKGEK